MNEITKVCSICGKEIGRLEWNNPYPVDRRRGRVCCSKCNRSIVVPSRMREARELERDRPKALGFSRA